jgi:hypothetical protein
MNRYRLFHLGHRPSHGVSGCVSTAPVKTGVGDVMDEGRKSSNSWYRAWKAMRFLPTRSRRWDKLILHIYGEGNGWWEADDVRAGWSTFNDGGGGFWGHSSSRNSSKGGGGGGEPSSKQRFGVRCFGSMSRRARARGLMAARCWTAKALQGILFIGDKLRHASQGLLIESISKSQLETTILLGFWRGVKSNSV